MYIIYQITNTINNKSYVGLTQTELKQRWYKHRYDARSKNSPLHFHRAIRKYDISVWRLGELCSCTSKSDAEYMERHFISDLKTFTEGYNMTKGGLVGPILCGKANGMYGRTHTDEVKQRLSKATTARLKGKSYEDLYGKKKSDQLRQKRSEDMKAHRRLHSTTGTNNPNAKRVHIKGITFNTSSDAAVHFNRSRPTISEWLRKYEDCYFI